MKVTKSQKTQGSPERRNWHLERRITVSVIIGLVIVFFGLVGNAISFTWYASKLDSTVNSILEVNDKQDIRLDAFETREREQAKLSERLAGLEAKVENTNRMIENYVYGGYSPKRKTK